MLKEIIARVSTITNGFKPIELDALNFFKSNPLSHSKKTAIELLDNTAYQVRSFAVFLLGHIASKDTLVLKVLKEKVSRDGSWQVQEILAKAFGRFCHDNGYENSLPVIKDWLCDENPNVCRAVTEGLRIWTGRPYFNSNPEIAIRLISQHKSNDSEYLRKSVGNALRDISKKHPELIDKETSSWDLNNKKIHFTYKLVIKNRK